MKSVLENSLKSQVSSLLNVGIFIYPGVTMIDAYAPLQVLVLSRKVNVFTFAKDEWALPSDANVDLLPNYSFDNCPSIDVLIVPGSANPLAQIEDQCVITFIKSVGMQAKYITSVCTGALILAEAGLLDGYKTTTHWAYAKALEKYSNVNYVNERVVKDRNRISGGGITSGLDFALFLVGEIAGKDVGQGLELTLEYDPQPPFNTGNNRLVNPDLRRHVQSQVNGLASDLFNRS
ncbi:DJ-1/PfpI family protein [Vibrio cyclitrophicus]|uniref:DJ-1/PfpI family protein n=1 Tax=Vibrio cyclitrophicus TaxID=47951 RepID=UPI000C82EF10|nr:DJ-1/PfpI family protein [Vibrio cyclitrophicus]PMH73187.1 thiamine biosynthesis protein ThiJ [Vibrio cyclitrophicus]